MSVSLPWSQPYLFIVLVEISYRQFAVQHKGTRFKGQQYETIHYYCETSHANVHTEQGQTHIKVQE